ncbi:hypothetical protein Asppvi_011379 [Aspergillus pseudoviridinutans]|uniref:Uncharacterized protein n=1 Tax=Aspergillus pseudoviridinutans TaxID=1517512 RepID=A0A9P3BJR5_9EURO|nr:uncharacterized protein Asppvi_011379 [Aspergillus pseudoviridinutans]GIJ92397.1 hypothetical protein Asppvi_011379 [Aspergillus pseudoviridinutans]
MKSTVEQFDTDKMIEMWQSRVCSKGCKPTFSDFDFLRDKFGIPIIKAESEKIGVSNLTPHYIHLMNAGKDMAERKCETSKFGDQDLCQNPSMLKELFSCMRRNIWSLALSQLSDVLPILLANPCKIQEDYIRKPEVLEQTIPAYMDDYASRCNEERFVVLQVQGENSILTLSR